jgi:hypothetical protein
MVRTSPFHGGNRGSNPLGVTKAPVYFIGAYLFTFDNNFLTPESERFNNINHPFPLTHSPYSTYGLNNYELR